MKFLWTLSKSAFQFSECNLRLLILRPSESKNRLRRPFRRMVKQSFIHVADLFHVKSAEAQTPPFSWSAAVHLHLQKLQGFERMQHSPIVDRKWARLCRLPRGFGRTPLRSEEHTSELQS